VGDIDEFIKVGRPDGKPEELGLNVLDEPSGKQSDPTVLNLQLRQVRALAGWQPAMPSCANQKNGVGDDDDDELTRPFRRARPEGESVGVVYIFLGPFLSPPCRTNPNRSTRDKRITVRR
jgi:hypothetical protein